METVHEHLATPYGLMLFASPFVKTSIDVMRAVAFNPSVKENAGIFNHTQGWTVIPECLLGHGDRAYPYYRTSMPAAYNERAKIRQIERVVKGQTTYSIYSPRAGNARTPQEEARNRGLESGPRPPRRHDGHPQRPDPPRQPHPGGQVEGPQPGRSRTGLAHWPCGNRQSPTERREPNH